MAQTSDTDYADTIIWLSACSVQRFVHRSPCAHEWASIYGADALWYLVCEARIDDPIITEGALVEI